LTEIAHGQKLSHLGPGGLTWRTASFQTRDIHPSYYGHIFPIDTSKGMNVGLVASLSIHAKIGQCSSLQSPFDNISERSREEHMVYLLPGEDEYEYYHIATINSFVLHQGIQVEQITPARYR
jgi:DNA-directed RNA polymerase subunit beta